MQTWDDFLRRQNEGRQSRSNHQRQFIKSLITARYTDHPLTWQELYVAQVESNPDKDVFCPRWALRRILSDLAADPAFEDKVTTNDHPDPMQLIKHLIPDVTYRDGRLFGQGQSEMIANFAYQFWLARSPSTARRAIGLANYNAGSHELRDERERNLRTEQMLQLDNVRLRARLQITDQSPPVVESDPAS